MLDLSDYYSGSYFLVKAGKPDWETLRDPLLADKLVSLATCICSHFEVYWGWMPGDKESALNFGIPEDKLEEFLEWDKKDYAEHIAYAGMFFSIAGARQFVKRFLPDAEDIVLVGLGIHKELEARWRDQSQDDVYDIEKRIKQHLPLEAGGALLGYDVVSYGYHDFGHSWLCSYNLTEIQEMFGVSPNRYGLFETYEDARKVDQWIFEDDMKGTRAEPEPYDAWLLMSYTLE